MTNQDSLFFKIFKSKVFPHDTIFYAKKNKGSFAWQSILEGCDIIKKGMKCRIGNDSFVRIYQDDWLPRS